MRWPDLQRIALIAIRADKGLRPRVFEVVQRHYIEIYQANFLLCYVRFIPL